jgi:glycosyltransferase involved in cell wall biosynthesis
VLETPEPLLDPGPAGQGLSRVAAVVVTYRRPRLATQVVRNLLESEGLPANQVFVVVNGEGGLSDPVLEAQVRVVHLSENLGPAAGFREGMLAALRSGPFDWCYLCEDDVGLFSLPSPRLGYLLEGLATYESEPVHPPVGAVVAYGRDLHRRSGHTTVHHPGAQDGFEAVDAACWGATLVHRRVLEGGVLPDDSYFFGYEDFDFYYRLRQAGYGLLLDCRAASSVESQVTLAGREAAFTGQRPVDADEPWRAFYVSRNYFLLAHRHGSPSWVAAHLLYSVRRLQLAPSGAERRAIVAGLLAGASRAKGKDSRFTRQVGELRPNNRPSNGSLPVPAGGRRVLHVLPVDIARGGQVIARDLRDLLNKGRDRHEILTIFGCEPVLLSAEHRLDVPMGWRRSAGFDPLAYRQLRSALRRLDPDVVVAHGGEPLKYLALVERTAPLIYFAFGILTDKARSGLRRSLYATLARRADMVVAISNEVRDEAREVLGIHPGRLALIPNSRDPGTYRPAPPGSRPAGPVRLLFVGHLTATKRPELFIRAVAELRRRGHRVHGYMVGDGPLEAQVRQLVPEAGVEVLGRRTDVPELLRQADIFVFTSVPESEGMPGVLIESGMSGLPTVATDCPGASTVVLEGRTGHVVGVHDFEALIGATERLVADPELRTSMGRAARERCVRDFSLESVARQWKTLLSGLAGL